MAERSAGTRAGRQRTALRGRVDQGDIDELVTAFLTASRVLVGVSAQSLAELDENVTIAQFRMLVVLDSREGISLNRLADELDVAPSTAMRMVDRLLAGGIVTRQDNPANRRQVVLGLTSEGRRVVETVTRRRRAHIAKIIIAMPAERRTELVAALHAFAEAAGEPSSDKQRVSSLGW